MSEHDADAVVEIDERYSEMMACRTMYSRRTDKELIEGLLAHAAGMGLGAAWGASPLSNAIEEICQRYVNAQKRKPGDRLPGGLVVVPEEPSATMVKAGMGVMMVEDDEEARDIYIVMLRAASGD